MDRVAVNQLTVDRFTGRQVDRSTGSYGNLIYGSEQLRVVVNRLKGGQSCNQPVDGRQVDMFKC